MTEGHHPFEGPSTEASNECFVAVHIGAGRHSRKTEQQYKTGTMYSTFIDSGVSY